MIKAAFASEVAENPSGDSGPCEPGWVDATDLDLGCLLIGNDYGTFQDANTFCYNNSAHLVEIFTENQMDFMLMQLEFLETVTGRGRAYWAGGTDWNREGQWYWAHSLMPIESFVWYSPPFDGPAQQPNGDTNDNYMTFYPGLGYYCDDVPNFWDQGYPICQKNSTTQ